VTKYQTKAFTNAKPIALPDDASPEWIAIDVEFGSTAYVAGDLIQLATIPAGYKVLDWVLNFPDIDSGATPALAWSIGVANNTFTVPVSTDIGTEVWGSALTAGQTTSIVRNTTNVSAQGATVDTTTIPGNREIVLKCTTAAATYAGSGKIGQILLLAQG
jgi:hypothetical protein